MISSRPKESKASVTDPRSGQIMVLYCWLMFILVGVLAVTLNFAGLFTYHAHLQTSSDLSAYSGAVMQARGLNDIARVNDDIVRELRRAQRAMRSSIYSSGAAGAAAAARAKASFDRYNARKNAEQRAINSRRPTEARGEAESIAQRNQAGLGAVQFTSYPNNTGQLTALRLITAETRNFAYRYYEYYWVWIGSGENARRVQRRRVVSNSGPGVSAKVSQKGTRDHTYFCVRLLRPFKEFMFTWGGAWPAGYEELRTYATAMPFGGNLWDGGRGRARYDAKLVRTGEVTPRPAIPDGWGYDW